MTGMTYGLVTRKKGSPLARYDSRRTTEGGESQGVPPLHISYKCVIENKSSLPWRNMSRDARAMSKGWSTRVGCYRKIINNRNSYSHHFKSESTEVVCSSNTPAICQWFFFFFNYITKHCTFYPITVSFNPKAQGRLSFLIVATPSILTENFSVTDNHKFYTFVRVVYLPSNCCYRNAKVWRYKPCSQIYCQTCCYRQINQHIRQCRSEKKIQWSVFLYPQISLASFIYFF